MEYSNKTYSISYGAGWTAFFAESEPDSKGIVRGTIATDSEDEKVTACEPASVHMDDLTEIMEGVEWPKESIE